MVQQKKADARTDFASRKQTFVRDEIMTSAANLFAERGYAAVTMGDIAEKLGYTKSVVYYYFKSKNEVLWKIFCRSLERFSGDIQAIVDEELPPTAAMHKMVYQHALNVMRYPEWSVVYAGQEEELTPEQRKQLNAMKRQYDAIFEKVYQSGVNDGSFTEIPPHIMVRAVLGMCNSITIWYDEGGAMSAEQIAEYYVRIISDGFLVGKRARTQSKRG